MSAFQLLLVNHIEQLPCPENIGASAPVARHVHGIRLDVPLLLLAHNAESDVCILLVREHDIRRTPTVLVLDRAGVVRRRAAGLPRKADVIAALGEVIGPAKGSQEQ